MLRCDLQTRGLQGLSPIIHALRGGAVVIIPTDTIYGFSARIDRPSALRRILKAKGRDKHAPFLVLISALEDLTWLTGSRPPAPALQMMWPGPVTLLLEARSALPPPLVGARGTVAVRMPAAALVRGILESFGRPIVSTSVNRSGEDPLNDPTDIARRFGHEIDVLADAGPLDDPTPSTVVDLTRPSPVVVRQGRTAVDLERLSRLLRARDGAH